MYRFPTQSSLYSSMTTSIQGHLLEITVVGCNKLKDTEWISRQDPYVCLEYGSTKFRTRTHTDGGKNPTFQEKFTFTLIEGLREVVVAVWNSNTLTYDDFIGSGKVQLQKVLTQGFDDSSWPLQTKTGRYAGEVRLIIHYSNANKPATSYGPSAPPYAAPPPSHQYPQYSAPPPTSGPPYPPPPSLAYPPQSPYNSYPHSSSAYQPSAYQPSAYPPPPQSAYPQQPYPPPPSSAYPPPPSSIYPPPPYPPPPQSSSYYPPSPFPGVYPPPPY